MTSEINEWTTKQTNQSQVPNAKSIIDHVL